MKPELLFDWSNGNDEKIASRPFFTRAVVERMFQTAQQVIVEARSSVTEDRWQLFTMLERRAVTVVFTLRGNMVRPISARPMSAKERQVYAKEIGYPAKI